MGGAAGFPTLYPAALYKGQRVTDERVVMSWYAFSIFVLGGVWALCLVWCVVAYQSFGYGPRHAEPRPYDWARDGL